MMLPPRPIRRLILAPLLVVTAVALVVGFPVLAVVTVLFGLVGRLARLSRPQHMRGLRRGRGRCRTCCRRSRAGCSPP